MPDMKGITVRIPADLHAEVKAYLEAHGMTMGEFITQAVDNELHPKILMTQEEPLERMRTLAFQVPDGLFQRVKAYLERNHMTQKQFVVGLIEAELEQDEAQYQSEQPVEQEDEEESDEQTDEETQDEVAPRRPQRTPAKNWRNNPQPRRTPPPWKVLRLVPRKCPRRIAGPRKPGRKPKKRKKCSRTAKEPRTSMG